VPWFLLSLFACACAFLLFSSFGWWVDAKNKMAHETAEKKRREETDERLEDRTAVAPTVLLASALYRTSRAIQRREKEQKERGHREKWGARLTTVDQNVQNVSDRETVHSCSVPVRRREKDATPRYLDSFNETASERHTKIYRTSPETRSSLGSAATKTTPIVLYSIG